MHTMTRETPHTMSGPPKIDPHAVGERLALARKLEGLKQSDAAEKLGVITRTWQNYEAGRIPWDHLDEIATLLNRSKGWILYGEIDPSELTRFPGDLPREVRDELANRHDEVMIELRAQSEMLRELLAITKRRKA